MARQIIILERSKDPGNITFRVVFWLAVPASRQPLLADASAVSVVKDGSVTGGELASIQTGAVREITDTLSYPNGTSLVTIEGDLQAQFTQRQTDLTNDNSLQRYGSFWDGAAWTAKNIS